jgi:peptidoglycan/xylan/chitin deacetylase (PgdA/CDA1 family)
MICFRSRGVLVLLYHRVTELARDPWSLAVPPSLFAQQLDVLRKHADCVQLDAAVKHPGARMFQRPRIAVTFDDGYADNFHEAATILNSLGIPATVFVVSGAVGNDREFWWDELERIVFDSNGARIRQVDVFSRLISWRVPETSGQDKDTWQAWQDDTPSDAHRAYRELYLTLSSLPPDERNATMDDLVSQTQLARGARPTHRTLSFDEVRNMAGMPMIEIGVHTVSHPILSRLPPDQQTWEIAQAKSDLESITGSTMRHFSYPYGKSEHYDRQTIDLVRDAGFESACTNEPGITTSSVDRFRIPRVVAPALPGPQFERWLTHCLATVARNAA